MVDALDRSPIAGATVMIPLSPVSAQTDAEGKALLYCLTWTSNFFIQAHAPGYAPNGALIKESPLPGETIRHTLALQPGATVSGIVLDPEGNPLEGAEVILHGPSALNINGRSGIKSDANGLWTSPPLAAGTYQVFATHPRYFRGTAESLTLDGKTPVEGVTIQMEPSGVISGRVVFADGAPAEGAAVAVARPDRSQAAFFERDFRVFSGPDGAFRLEGLPLTKLLLVADIGTQASRAYEIDLTQNPEKSDLEVVLDVEGVIGGIVVDTKGNPLPDIHVWGQPKERSRDYKRWDEWMIRRGPSTLTDPDGRFLLQGLPEGVIELFAYPPGRMGAITEAPTEAKTGDMNVRIVMEGNGAIKGKLRYSDGGAPKEFSVTALNSPPVRFKDSDGSFLIEGVNPGQQQIEIKGPEMVDFIEGGFVVKGGETTDVGVLTVERTRTIRGKVLLASGEPVKGALVVAGAYLSAGSESLNPASGKSTNTEADGSFVLPGVERKAFQIAAEHPTHGRSPLTPLAAGPDDLEVELILSATGALEGTVTRGGEPFEGLILAFPEGESVASTAFTTMIGPDGKYRFGKLAPGRYVLRPRPPQNARRGPMEPKVATVKANETTTLNINLPKAATLAVTLARKDGAPLPGGYRIALIRGPFQESSASEMLETLMALPPGTMSIENVRPGNPAPHASFQDTLPGEYTLCAIGSPAPAEENQSEAPASVCQPVTVRRTPEVQEVTLSL